MTEQRATWLINALTIALSVAWLFSFAFRQFHPLEGGAVLDGMMLLVLGWWFSKSAFNKDTDKAEEESDVS